MSKKKLYAFSARGSGKTKLMQQAIDEVFKQNPLARVAIVSTSGTEIIEGTDYEEVKPMELPSPNTDHHETD